jgi:sugar transferase (PEP-CTERM/EpsH1 system associated)
VRILVLSQRLPYAPNRGDRVRVHHIIRELTSRARVDVAALVHDREEASHVSDLGGLVDQTIAARVPRLRNLCLTASGLVRSVPLTHVLLDSPSLVPSLAALVRTRRPDVTLAFCSSMARFALDGPLAGTPCVVDLIDADSAKWAAMAQTSAPPLRWIFAREARLLARFELRIMREAHATLVVNEKERSALHALDPGGRVQVIENGVDLASFARPPGHAESSSVVFCGVMNYRPNVQGALWLAREVWPLVRATNPMAKLFLVGASPTPEVRALHDRDASVTVTGTVEDVRPYLWSAAAAAAPLHLARGVQNKVLEAIAAGLPCVVTPAVAEGLPHEALPACSVAGNVQPFAAALGTLLNRSRSEQRAIASNANLAPLSWSTRLAPLWPILEAARDSTPSRANGYNS